MTCEVDILGNTEYQERLHLLFHREWTRAYAGDSGLREFDKAVRSGGTVNVPDTVLEDTTDVIVAMDTGKVVPGTWEQNGECYQDWTRTACFARWYMTQNGDVKAQIRDLLQAGNAEPWMQVAGSEDPVLPCPAGKLMSMNCCPSTVWADPAYLDLMRPADKPTSWWALGLGAVALGLGAAYVKAKW